MRWCGSLLVAVGLSAAGPAPASSTADIDVLHYALTITPDFDRRSVSGETHISFRSQRDALAEIRFSANSLIVDRATVRGQPVRATRDNADAVMSLPQPLARGQTATLTIAFHGVPARGLVFGTRSVYTSYFTCDWMFCVQDRPGDKATLDLTVVVPKGMTSVGVGPRGSVTPAAGELNAHASRETRPYSSYVYGFAAGDFHVVSVGKPRDRRRLERILAQRGHHDVHGRGLEGTPLGTRELRPRDGSGPAARGDGCESRDQRAAHVPRTVPLAVRPARHPGPKGALFMDRLRRDLGERTFWAGLRSFTRTHAGTTVDSRDFQRVFERTSGRSLEALFDEWVR